VLGAIAGGRPAPREPAGRASGCPGWAGTIPPRPFFRGGKGRSPNSLVRRSLRRPAQAFRHSANSPRGQATASSWRKPRPPNLPGGAFQCQRVPSGGPSPVAMWGFPSLLARLGRRWGLRRDTRTAVSFSTTIRRVLEMTTSLHRCIIAPTRTRLHCTATTGNACNDVQCVQRRAMHATTCNDATTRSLR
jgi:hypothetical protein